MFEIGQMVVCVQASWDSIHIKQWELYLGHKLNLPYVGQILTIRNFYAFEDDGALGLVFQEIRNPYIEKWNFEASFSHTHFKPVKKTNIDVFTSMLKPIDELV